MIDQMVRRFETLNSQWPSTESVRIVPLKPAYAVNARRPSGMTTYAHFSRLISCVSPGVHPTRALKVDPTLVS